MDDINQNQPWLITNVSHALGQPESQFKDTKHVAYTQDADHVWRP